MISKETCQKIVDQAVSQAGRRAQIEVCIEGSNVATSRFAVNSMTQNQCPDKVIVSVRALTKGRQARLRTDDLSKKGIAGLVDDAIAAAKRMEPDQELLSLPTPTQVRAVQRLHARTAHMTPDQRASHIRAAIDVVQSQNLECAGVYASGHWFTALGNSRGLFLHHPESSAVGSVTVVAPDSTGWAKADAVRASDFDYQNLAGQALNAALKSANPAEIPPGRYTVILPPSAVLDLLSFLWYDFCGTSHSDKISSLLGKVGHKLFGDNITITDDVYHPLQAGAPFDGEGLQRARVTLVEKGVLKSLVHGRRSAAKFGVKATGHGLLLPNAMAEYPMNLVMEGGDTPLEQMVSQTKRGILLTRVWYVRVVDPQTVLLTGMTRDGTFLVENGEIVKGIKNLRFNVSVHDLLNHVIALGPALRAAGEEGFPAVVPAMQVADFNFTSVTKF